MELEDRFLLPAVKRDDVVFNICAKAYLWLHKDSFRKYFKNSLSAFMLIKE